MAYKEIVTKAIVGKGKKKYQDTYKIEVEDTPTTVLGCWIINHVFSGKENNKQVEINGSYDVNIWYSYDNDTKTKVVNKNITYNIIEKINLKDDISGNKDIIIRSIKQPTAISAKEDGNIINIEIEKELGIEIIGDAKVKVSSVEEEDVWDILDEEKTIDNIDTNYIKENQLK